MRTKKGRQHSEQLRRGARLENVRRTLTPGQAAALFLLLCQQIQERIALLNGERAITDFEPYSGRAAGSVHGARPDRDFETQSAKPLDNPSEITRFHGGPPLRIALVYL